MNTITRPSATKKAAARRSFSVRYPSAQKLGMKRRVRAFRIGDILARRLS